MGMTTKEILQGVHDWTDDNFGRKDGFYEQLVSGGALALIGQTQRTNDAMYRKSGDPEQVITGDAIITKIQGQTKAWNQMYVPFNNGTRNGVTYSQNPLGGVDLSGSVTGATSEGIPISKETYGTMSFMNGRKYLVHFTNTGGHTICINGFSKYTTSYIQAFTQNWTGKIMLGVQNDEQVSIQNLCVTVFDLTAIYDAGNEPSSVAQFEQDYFNWFGKPLTYEEYDAGSLRSVQLDAIKTTGFNQWDEEWKNYGGNLAVGAFNKIKVISGQKYWFQVPVPYYFVYWLFDANGYILGTTNKIPSEANYAGAVARNELLIPLNVTHIMFAANRAYGTSYNHDICINISDTAKNGTYEPFEEHVAPLHVTTLKGKLNGEGESVTIFPDGMRSVGTIVDEIYTVGDKTYAVVRVGSVDLGSLDWSIPSGTVNYFVSSNIFGLKQIIIDEPFNIICSAYSSVGKGTFYADFPDKKIGITANSTQTVVVKDTSYSDASIFKTAMTGVTLVYELAEPLVYEVEGFTLPKTYLVDGGGTEEQVQKSGVQGLAAILTCIYGVDAVGFINKAPQRFIGEDSMDNFLAKLNIATGGTWSKTFNENTGEWDFNYTPAANTNANTNEESI